MLPNDFKTGWHDLSGVRAHMALGFRTEPANDADHLLVEAHQAQMIQTINIKICRKPHALPVAGVDPTRDPLIKFCGRIT